MDDVVKLIEQSTALASEKFDAVLKIAADNRGTIRSLIALMENIQGIDKERLTKILSDLDAFDDELSKPSSTPA